MPLAVVSDASTPEETPFARACRAKLEEALKDGAEAMMIVYENGNRVVRMSVPDIEVLEMGFALHLANELLPKGE